MWKAAVMLRIKDVIEHLDKIGKYADSAKVVYWHNHFIIFDKGKRSGPTKKKQVRRNVSSMHID